MTLNQDVDAIIAEENINDTVPAVAPVEEAPPEDPSDPVTPPVEGDPADPVGEVDPDKPADPSKDPVEPPKEDTPSVVTLPPAPATAVKFDESQMFDEQGNVKPFNEVVKIGEYLASQIAPVEVVGKDGKTYTFNTVKDVNDQFPDGFEAKNSLEAKRFEAAIVNNDNKFNDAVGKLREAEQEYQQYTTQAVETRKANESIASEYRAMADQGLVPKVGDPNDPKFGESEAVKELNKIIEWRDATNAKNAEKGLGQIQSLYVAKQLMDIEDNKVEKDYKSKQIHQERVEVASLSSSPAPDTGKRPPVQDVPLSRLADEIIASEGLK